MAEIPLTQGFTALVDDDDVPLLSEYRWTAHDKKTRSNTVYAVSSSQVDGKRSRVHMHRLIMDAPAHLQVDHINGNGLDNRRSNLRLATQSQNQGNRPGKQPHGFKGVTKLGWKAAAMGDGKAVHLGYYDTPEEAARAYDAWAFARWGAFAYLNFPAEHDAQNLVRD